MTEIQKKNKTADNLNAYSKKENHRNKHRANLLRIIRCECGRSMSKGHLIKHRTSIIHMELMEEKERDFKVKNYDTLLAKYKKLKNKISNETTDYDQEVKNKWTKLNKQNIKVFELLTEHYEITKDPVDTVDSSDLTKFRDYNTQVFQTISLYRFHDILRELGLVECRNQTTRVWIGIRPIKKEETSSDSNENKVVCDCGMVIKHIRNMDRHKKSTNHVNRMKKLKI
jgi:hypothetical protein